MHYRKLIRRAARPRTLSDPGLLHLGSTRGLKRKKKKKKMTKAKRAAAQEGVSAFEVELIQRRASVLTDAPQDKDLRSRRCAKDRLPCLENLRLFWRFKPFCEGFIFFSTTLCRTLTRLTIGSENLLLVKSRGSGSVTLRRNTHLPPNPLRLVYKVAARLHPWLSRTRLTFQCLDLVFSRDPVPQIASNKHVGGNSYLSCVSVDKP